MQGVLLTVRLTPDIAVGVDLSSGVPRPVFTSDTSYNYTREALTPLNVCS